MIYSYIFFTHFFNFFPKALRKKDHTMYFHIHSMFLIMCVTQRLYNQIAFATAEESMQYGI